MAVRNILRNQQGIKNNKLADAFVTGHSKDFSREVKRVNCMRTVTSPVIEGYSDPRDIANAISNNFSEKHCIENRRNNFTVEEVIFTRSILKPNKKDADLSLNSLSIINASHNFYIALCLLINIVIVHGNTPLAWQAGTILPLLKSGSLDKSLLTSYRPITLFSLFSKIIDLLIVNRYNDVLYSSECQFSFKKGHSTNMCTYVVKEAASNYINNDSAASSCAIDMSKAFDRVNLVKLFKRLSLRALPVHY